MDILLIIALAGFSIKCFKDLSEVAFTEWQTVQWLTLLVGILLIGLCVIRTILFAKTFKVKQDARTEKREDSLAKLEEEKRMREERRKAIYLFDEEDRPEGEEATVLTEIKSKEDQESDSFIDMLIDKATEEHDENHEQD